MRALSLFLLVFVVPALLTAAQERSPTIYRDTWGVPHIYGPIDRAAIVEERPVRRAPDGEFLGW